MAKVNAISYYLPEEVVTNEHLNMEFPEWSVDKISSKTGIYSRHIAASNELCSDMAVKACELLFSEYQIKREEIDFVLLCTQSPDHPLPTTACIVQDRLKLNKNVGALDFNLGCSGYIYGLALAKGLVDSGISKKLLLITSEIYSRYIQRSDKSNRTLFGDAASATLIEADGTGGEIANFSLGTDGSGAKNLIVKNGWPGSDEQVKASGNYLFMDGPEIFNFTAKAVPGLVEDVLSVNSLALNDIALFIFHQANKFMLNYIRKKIGIPEDKFFLYLESCGNTVSSTIPIALKQALMDGKIKSGDKVLLAGFGVGYSWGGTSLKF